MQNSCKFNFYNTHGVKAGGEEALRASERRREILEVLCQRRQDTRENLAQEFGVSLRTISNDIEILSLTYPIETKRGKYGGGVRVLDGYRLDRKYLTSIQQCLLERLANTLYGEDRNILESILRDFTLKDNSRV